MPSIPESSILEGSFISLAPNKNLNALKMAECLDTRIMEACKNALARKQERAGENNQFLMQMLPIKCFIRHVVFYAKHYSRRKCGARNHGDSLLISE